MHTGLSKHLIPFFMSARSGIWKLDFEGIVRHLVEQGGYRSGWLGLSEFCRRVVYTRGRDARPTTPHRRTLLINHPFRLE